MRRIDGATLTVILSALGLSGATGLNAWLPLLLTAGFQRAGWVELDATWVDLGSTPVLIGLATMFVLDFVGDKVPLIDHAVHAVGAVVHPIAGTVIFDAQAGSDVSLLVSAVLGGGTAGLLHTARASARPVVSGSTGGLGSPVASLMEDAAAFLLVIVAFVLPVIAGLIVVALLIGGVVAARRMRRRMRRRRGGTALPPVH